MVYPAGMGRSYEFFSGRRARVFNPLCLLDAQFSATVYLFIRINCLFICSFVHLSSVRIYPLLYSACSTIYVTRSRTDHPPFCPHSTCMHPSTSVFGASMSSFVPALTGSNYGPVFLPSTWTRFASTSFLDFSVTYSTGARACGHPG